MRHLLIFSLMLSSLSASAEAMNYVVVKGCRIGYEHDTAGVTASWDGDCKDGYADGKGVLRWFQEGQPKDAYEGYLVAGLPDGQGYLLTADDTSYAGNFSHGKPQGLVTRTNAKGQKLVATFEAGLPVGVVDYTDARGNHYHGGWNAQQGGPHGLGSMDYALGGHYEGQWLDGKPIGSGTIIYPNGVKIEGVLGPNPMADQYAQDDRRAGATFGIKSDESQGPIRRDAADGFEVPVQLSYSQLSKEEQRRVKRAYPILQEGDEPPYPLKGTQSIGKDLIAMQNRIMASGRVVLSVLIDTSGNPTSITIWQAPDAEVGKIAATVLMLNKYKPASCAGVPCAMSYPFTLRLTKN